MSKSAREDLLRILQEWAPTNEEYHASDGYSWSQFEDLMPPGGREVFHVRHVLGQHRRKVTDEMRLGTAVHSALLEPDEFESSWAVEPSPEELGLKIRRGGAWDEAIRSRSQNGKIELLRPVDWSRLQGMVDSVENHEEADTLTGLASVTEASLRVPLGHFEVRVRYDAVSMPSSGSVVHMSELKTTSKGHPDQWRSDWVHKWIPQLASREWALREVGFEGEIYWWSVIVESESPYRVYVVETPREWKIEGRRRWNWVLKEAEDGFATGNWKSREQAPEWAPEDPKPWEIFNE